MLVAFGLNSSLAGKPWNMMFWEKREKDIFPKKSTATWPIKFVKLHNHEKIYAKQKDNKEGEVLCPRVAPPMEKKDR